MQTEFRFPDIGEGITEGEIVEWLVKEGDFVEEHQAVGKIETDKAVAEIPSPQRGYILKLMFKPGDTVKVGEVLFVIGDKKNEQVAKVEQQKVPPKPVAEQQTVVKQRPVVKPAGVVGYLEEAPELKEAEEIEDERVALKKLQQSLPTKAEHEILAAPATRKLAKDLGIDLTKMTGTGKEGRITDEDVKNAKGIEIPQTAEISELKVQKKYDFYGNVERIPLKGVRKSIAKKMAEMAQHVIPVSAHDEADVTQLWHVREREKKIAEMKGIKLTFLPFIAKALIHALKDFPYVNSTFDEENQEIVLKKYYNIGIAVDTEDGLIVPVVKDADQKSILDIAKEIEELAQKARERKLDLADLKGGTFSITNYGSIRGLFATPIINYPEAAILGMGRIYDKLVVEGEKVYKKKVLPISFTFDHRIFDGAYAERFMDVFIKHLEDPDLILVDRD
jgi:pyruvate dehydrogenase E2 component (dihydrolipoamide acetyltransferase)